MDSLRDSDDSLINLPVDPPSLVKLGGDPTGIYDRWSQKKVEVKKYIDDVSRVEKLQAAHQYSSKININE